MLKFNQFLVFISLFLFIACAQKKRDYSRAQESSNQASGVSDGEGSRIIDGQSRQKSQKGRILTYKGNLHIQIAMGQSPDIRNKIFDYLEKLEGYITSETSTTLSIKVPSAKYREAIQFLKGLGKVTYEAYSVEDITESYYDSKIRLENAVKLQERLTDLLKRAKSVQEAVEVERELNRVTNEIETHKSHLFRLDNQIQFSTLSLHLEEKKETKLGPIGWIFYGLYTAVSYLFVIE